MRGRALQPTLIVREACEHNLRAVSLDLPHPRGRQWPVRVGQDFPRIGHDLRRGASALSRGVGWRALRVPKASRIDGLAPPSR